MSKPSLSSALSRRTAVCSLLAASCMLTGGFFSASALAQSYPNKPIKVVVMFPPGGGSDSQTRLIGDKIRGLIGQPFIVDNRPGAGGIIAATAVKGAPADGYTLLHAGMALMTLTPKLNPAATYSPGDFIPVAGISTANLVLVARAAFPANNVQELVALAKAKPGEINYGTWGPGSLPHVAGERLEYDKGIRMNAIAYKGEVPLIQGMLGDDPSLGWVTLPSLLPHLKSGKLKVIGVAAANRDPLLPNVPTFIEQGVPDFDMTGWTGFFVLKGTPAEVVTLLNAKINEVLKMPEVQSRIAEQGQTVTIMTGAQLGEVVRKTAARLTPTLDKLAPSLQQ